MGCGDKTFIYVDKNGDMCKGQAFMVVLELKVAQKPLFYNSPIEKCFTWNVTHETNFVWISH